MALIVDVLGTSADAGHQMNAKERTEIQVGQAAGIARPLQGDVTGL